MRSSKTASRLIMCLASSFAAGVLSIGGHAQSHKVDSTLRLLTYGLPRFEYQNATYVVGLEWGIEHYSVAGCIVSDELVDSVKKENDRVMAAIVKRFGTNWEERFNAEVQQEFERETRVMAPIRELSYIRARQKEMEAEGNGLHYWVIPGSDGDEIIVHGYAPWEGKTEWLALYTFKVDRKSGSLSLISDTPRKE